MKKKTGLFILFILALTVGQLLFSVEVYAETIKVENIKPGVTLTSGTTIDNGIRSGFFYNATTGRSKFASASGNPNGIYPNMMNNASIYCNRDYVVDSNAYFSGINVYINDTNSGNSYTVSIGANENITISELKDRIETLSGMPKASQILSYGGVVLDDETKTVEDYAIGHASTIDLSKKREKKDDSTPQKHVHEFIEGTITEPTCDHD